MTIKHDELHSQFVLYNDADEPIGEICYRLEGDTLFATHTAVQPGHEGQGLAGRLLDALVTYAADEGRRIVPVCPYVVRSFESRPEKYAHVR